MQHDLGLSVVAGRGGRSSGNAGDLRECSFAAHKNKKKGFRGAPGCGGEEEAKWAARGCLCSPELRKDGGGCAVVRRGISASWRHEKERRKRGKGEGDEGFKTV